MLLALFRTHITRHNAGLKLCAQHDDILRRSPQACFGCSFTDIRTIEAIADTLTHTFSCALGDARVGA